MLEAVVVRLESIESCRSRVKMVNVSRYMFQLLVL